MRTALVLLAGALLWPSLGAAQKLDLRLDALASKAKEKAELDLDGKGIPMKDLKTPPAKLSIVCIRNYEFASPGQYSEQDLDLIRRQLGSGSGWNRVVRTKEKNESTEIYLFARQGDRPAGILIIACEPREVSVVNIIGEFDPSDAENLVRSFAN
jgi:hypothetical protein